MYVHAVKHKKKPRFKIGKTRGTHKRLGGPSGFDAEMVVFKAVVARLGELGLDVFELCEQPKQSLHIESTDRELFDRAVGLVEQLRMQPFPVERDTLHGGRKTIVGDMRWRYDCGRYRLSADFNFPVTDANKHDLSPAYVEIMGTIPKSQVRRTPVEHDLVALASGNGYRPLPL